MAFFKNPNEGGYLGHLQSEGKKWVFGRRKSSPPKPEGSPDPGGVMVDASYPNVRAEHNLNHPSSQSPM